MTSDVVSLALRAHFVRPDSILTNRSSSCALLAMTLARIDVVMALPGALLRYNVTLIRAQQLSRGTPCHDAVAPFGA